MMPKMLKEDLIYPELSYQIVGILFAVSNELGGDYLEKYYQKALSLELKKAGLKFEEQVKLPLEYKGDPLGRYYADFIIDDKILLEIKKNKNFTPKNIQQVYAYLKAYKLKLGILANFTDQGLKFKRILNIHDS
jgi:GxxExxY protein